MSKSMLVVFIAFGLILGCDSGSDDNDSGAHEDTTASEDTVRVTDNFVTEPGDYPAPPFGKTVGSTIEDHSFLIPGEDTVIRLSDYYQHETKRVLLINASAGWCGACKQEAGELNNIFAAKKGDGLDILYTLFEDWNGGPVNEDFYDGWMDQYGGDYTTVLDPEFGMGIYFNVESTPMNMLVDLETMTIIWLETGFNPAALEAKLDEVLQ
jgi:hypothetical protein